MSAEAFQMISTVAFICGGIFTLIAVVLFVKFDIPSLIGELSGKTAEKKVQEIREQNRQAVSMRQRERKRKVTLYEPNAESVVAKTEKEPLKRAVPKEEKTAMLDEATEVLYQQTAVLDEATEVLYEQTAVLDEGYSVEEQTALLSEEPEEEGTMILSEESVSGDADFCMVQDVVEVHTSETI